jgi:hypothetical protein
MTPRIEREKAVVRLMIRLYCRHHLGQQEPSPEYAALADYACQRLDRCRFGAQKPTCRRCPIHCYAPAVRPPAPLRRPSRTVGKAFVA